MTNRRDWLRAATLELAAVSESPALEAELLLTQALSVSRTELLRDSNATIPVDIIENLRDQLKKRLEHYPLQYLLGSQQFYGRQFATSPGVLIPRVDTELLVSAVLESIAQRLNLPEAISLNILEIGSGSGIIPITILAELNAQISRMSRTNSHKISITSTDINPQATELSKLNQEKLGKSDLPPNTTAPELSLEFVTGDILPADAKMYDFVISNPPYIPARDREGWQSELNAEPVNALVGGQVGIEFTLELLTRVTPHLNEGAEIWLEIHPDTLAELLEGAERLGYKEIKHLAGLGAEVRFLCLHRLLEHY